MLNKEHISRSYVSVTVGKYFIMMPFSILLETEIPSVKRKSTPKAKALFDFDGGFEDELSFRVRTYMCLLCFSLLDMHKVQGQ